VKRVLRKIVREAAVALAIVVSIYRQFQTIDADEATTLKG